MKVGKKILLTTDFYLPNNTANGLCVYRLAKAFKDYGYEVHVIAFRYPEEEEEEVMEGITVHKFRPQRYFVAKRNREKLKTLASKGDYLLQVIWRRFLKLLFLPWFPMAYPSAIIRYTRKIEQVAMKEDIRNIILSYNPLESSAAVLFFKDRKKFTVINCFLDTFTMNGGAHRHKFVRWTGYRWEKKLFDKSDLITNFSIYHKHFEGREYDGYRYKMTDMDVPLSFSEMMGETPPHHGKVFLYTGGLAIGDRDPDDMAELFCAYYASHAEARLEIYGKSRRENFSFQSCEGILWHDFRPMAEVVEARKRADFLVNVGSKINTNVPSRILEHISTGKPIVHIYYRKDDPCLFYLKNYRYKLLINPLDGLEKNLAKLEKFVERNVHARISIEELEELYGNCSGKKIVKSMDEFFEKMGNKKKLYNIVRK